MAKDKAKKAIGRPTEWSEEVEASAWDYVSNFQDHDHPFPSLVGLCKVLNRGKTTIYKWAEDEDKGFRDIVCAINEGQELIVGNKAMTNDYNATMAKLLLTKHGYSDKVDTNIAGELKVKSFTEMYGKPES